MRRVISVFGSSAPQPGSQAYEEARLVGRLLAESGFAVATGGYGGTMKAVSQGASEGGGHVIGITAAQIERFRSLGPNQWVMEEIKYETLRERMMHLVVHNVGMVALPGGIGTLAEMTLAWSFLQVGEIEARPFALLGPSWASMIDGFYEPQYIQEKHLQLLHFAQSPQMAVAHIVESLS